MGNRLLIVTLVVILFGAIITVPSCGQSQQTESQKAIGSVITHEDYWGMSLGGKNYRIAVTVMNIGSDGVFTVNATVTPHGESKVSGSNTQSSTIYLKQGEEKALSFSWYVTGNWVSYYVWFS